MKISELKNAPEWLVLAKTENADVELHPDYGYVVWRGGEWRGGVWQGGVWRGGEWRGGEWRGGVWQGGVWRGGEWRGGEWRGGVWRGGVWRGGVWRGGEWRGGESVPRCKWYYGFENPNIIKIGCKKMTVEEWDAWFSSDNEYETKRGTEEFKMIQACFEATKAYINFINK